MAEITPRTVASTRTCQYCDDPGDVEHTEHEREQRQGALRDEQQAALVEPVGEHPAPHTEEHGRPELQRGDDAERGAGVGELEDEPVLRDALHPRAGERDQLTRRVQAVVAHAQRAEHAAVGGSRRGRGGCSRRHCSASLSRIGMTRCSSARSSGGQRGEPLGQPRVARAALGVEQRDARPGDRDDRLAPVGGVRRRGGRGRAPRGSASTFVIDGGCTRSHAASSPALIGPRFRSVPSPTAG